MSKRYKKKKWNVTRRQKPTKGGKEAMPACVIKEILRAVEKEAMSLGVSKSFVVAVRMAKSYGITEQEQF